MIRKIWFGISVAVPLLGLCVPSVFAQATFTVASSNATAADIGATELTGNLILTIISGTSVEAPFSIKYSAPITNNDANDVFVTGSGVLSVIPWTPVLDRANNTILIVVPAGGVTGNKIEIAGVRVALAGQGYSIVTALITGTSGTGNAISVGQNVATVINSIVRPLTIDQAPERMLSWNNGQAVNPATFFYVGEGFASAFSDKVNQFGQTVSTRIRVNPFPPLPAGVKLTFSATATSLETSAMLNTLSRAAETVPRSDGSSEVTYEFSGREFSPSTIESFRIQVTVTLDEGFRGTGYVQFQAALTPIGIAVPNGQFPSTDIPRFTERVIPDEAELVTGSVSLAFPFRMRSDGTYTGIAITNPQNYRVKVKLTAYDPNGNRIVGSDVTNPVNLVLPRSGQIAKLATDIFGPGINAFTAGTIIANGQTTKLEGFYLIGDTAGSRLDGATADITSFHISLLPAVFHQGPAAYNLLDIYNPGDGSANVQIKLYDKNGILFAATDLPQIPANGTFARDLTQIFVGLDLGSFLGGYLTCRSDNAVVVRETFGNALDSNVLMAQSGLQRKSIPIAHFAQGGGFITEINLINADAAVKAEITLTAFDNNGNALAIAGNPRKVSILPGAQLIQSMRDLFPALDASLTTGYVQMDVLESFTGFFGTTPVVLGSIRFSSADGYASASLPTILAPAADFVYSHVAQNLGYYTGIALLNTSSTITTVTMDVYTKDGIWMGVSGLTLMPNQKIAKLLYEMIPATAGQIGGYVRIRASQPILSFALFGTTDGKSLSAIPPQPVN